MPLPPLKNDRLLRALKRQPVDKTPIWIMRQAGRYLPEYRQLRAKAGSFLNLCKTPELACQATLQPISKFDLDAAIIFSDILTIPDAMGLELYFIEGEGPCFKYPIQSEQAIRNLFIPDPTDKLRYVMDAIQLAKKSLNQKVPLIGFAGSPWTLATYMVEGGSSKNFTLAKAMLYKSPTLMHELLTILSQAIAQYLCAQISAGVDVIMLFDTWGGLLTTPAYQEFSLFYMDKIIKLIKAQPAYAEVPIILFTKNGAQWLEIMTESGCDALGLDWTIDIKSAQKRVGTQVALQGNLDPAILYAEPSRIRIEAENILNNFGSRPGHIFNLGHGIYPGTPPEHVHALIEAVHNYQLSVQEA